mmetsp:Transcript_47414/g.112850  ORF Transcript_47414/g.112850 Transcript_47414/m.112850 type:complete len:515 (+) Transcript_47414:696-2240(+)
MPFLSTHVVSHLTLGVYRNRALQVAMPDKTLCRLSCPQMRENSCAERLIFTSTSPFSFAARDRNLPIPSVPKKSVRTMMSSSCNDLQASSGSLISGNSSFSFSRTTFLRSMRGGPDVPFPAMIDPGLTGFSTHVKSFDGGSRFRSMPLGVMVCANVICSTLSLPLAVAGFTNWGSNMRFSMKTTWIRWSYTSTCACTDAAAGDPAGTFLSLATQTSLNSVRRRSSSRRAMIIFSSNPPSSATSSRATILLNLIADLQQRIFSSSRSMISDAFSISSLPLRAIASSTSAFSLYFSAATSAAIFASSSAGEMLRPTTAWRAPRSSARYPAADDAALFMDALPALFFFSCRLNSLSASFLRWANIAAWCSLSCRSVWRSRMTRRYFCAGLPKKERRRICASTVELCSHSAAASPSSASFLSVAIVKAISALSAPSFAMRFSSASYSIRAFAGIVGSAVGPLCGRGRSACHQITSWLSVLGFFPNTKSSALSDAGRASSKSSAHLASASSPNAGRSAA